MTAGWIPAHLDGDCQGGAAMLSATTAGVARAAVVDSYSPREDQILRLIAAGLTDKAIALKLGISPKTVATHLGRLYARGGCHSRTEAVVRWLTRPAEE